MNIDDLIAELGIENLTSEQQRHVINELKMQLGDAMLEGLDAEQINEYEAIINGDQATITAWLEANDPGYEDTVAYQQLAVGSDIDPEKVPADKAYASIAWVEKHNPDLDKTIASIKMTMKTNLAQYSAGQ